MALARHPTSLPRTSVGRLVRWLFGRQASAVVAIGVLLAFWLVLVVHG